MDTQYNIRFTDINKSPIAINEGSKDNTTDVTLFGRIDLDYGQELDQDMLRLLEHFSRPEETSNTIFSPKNSNGYSGVSLPGVTSSMLTTLSPNTQYNVTYSLLGVNQVDMMAQTFFATTPMSGSGEGGAFTYGDLCEGVNNGNWVSSGTSNLFIFITDDSNGAYPSITGAQSNGFLIFQSTIAGYNQVQLVCQPETVNDLLSTLTNDNCGLVNATIGFSSDAFFSPIVDYSNVSDIALRSPSVGQVWFNETRQNYYYWTGVQWSPLKNSNSISGNSGTIFDGQQIPLPSNVLSYRECIWAISPSMSPSTNFDYMVCNTDQNATVNMKYQLTGSQGLTGTYANFIIVGIPHSTNQYMLGPNQPAPPGLTPTPTPSVTLSRTVTPAVSGTPAVTRTPAATHSPTPAVASPTPTRTRTPVPTSTPAVTHSPTPRPRLSGISSNYPNGIYAGCSGYPGKGLGPNKNECIAIAQPSAISAIGGTAPFKWCIVSMNGIPFGTAWGSGMTTLPICPPTYSVTGSSIAQQLFSQHAFNANGTTYTCSVVYKVTDATGASRMFTQMFYPTFVSTV